MSRFAKTLDNSIEISSSVDPESLPYDFTRHDRLRSLTIDMRGSLPPVMAISRTGMLYSLAT